MEESRVPEFCLLQCLCGSWRWTLRAFYFHRQDAVIRKPCFRKPMSCNFFFVLWRRSTFCWFACAFFVHPVLCLQIDKNNENCDSIGLNIMTTCEKFKIQRSGKASVLNYTYICHPVIHISVKL